MFFQSLITSVITIIFVLISFVITPSAQALVPIKIIDIGYKDCPSELAMGNVTSGGRANPATCYLVTGKTQNNSGKTLYDADLFGRIYDANDEPVLQNRNRIGSLPEVLPGTHEFELRISVASNQPTPLKLKQFKATGFSGHVYPSF